MKIGIVGGGYVGRAFNEMLKNHYEVIIYDPYIEDYKKNTKEQINECDLAIIAVPTPMDYDKGSPYPCNTKIVDETVAWLETPLILIKSTVAVGTTDELKRTTGKRIVFSPEYVGEGKYYVTQRMDFQQNMMATPFLILGGDRNDCKEIFDILIPILGPEKTYWQCSAKEAELIKYMENTYFGVKITFAQEMYEIAKALDCDWYKVWGGWALDPRVDRMHTAVFPNKRGFSGKCLPKDLNALVRTACDNGYDPIMLKAMLKSNLQFRGLNDYKEDETVQK